MMALLGARCTVSSWRAGLAVLTVVLLMAGCSGGGAASPDASTGPSPSTEGAGASPTLELETPKPGGVGEERYTGVLASDAIEGGCAFIRTPDGQRYQVIPPDGWELRATPAELIAPDGRVVARVGDQVTIVGHEADMVSICQIGPIIQATEVVVGG